MDVVLRALARKKSQWHEDLFFAVRLAQQMLSKYYADVTPWTGLLLILAHILKPFWKLWSFRKWDKGMDFNPEDETSYTTQYQEALLKYFENEYCAKLQGMSVNEPERLSSSNLVPSATTSGSGQSSFDPNDMFSDDEEYSMPNNVAETTPGRIDRAACWLNTSRLYSNSPPGAPENSGQMNLNHNDYHFNPMEISSTFWIPDITDWSPTQGNALGVHWSLHRGARHILYQTTWCWSGSQFVSQFRLWVIDGKVLRKCTRRSEGISVTERRRHG